MDISRAASSRPVAPRGAGETLEQLIRGESPRVIVVTGRPGNGLNTFLTRGLRQLAPDVATVWVSGSWPNQRAELLVCPGPTAIPSAPPPERLDGVRLVIGCYGFDELPEWLRSLRPAERAPLELGALSLSELHDFLRAHLDGPMSVATASRLGSITGRIPGLLTVALRVLSRSGRLAQIDGAWVLTSAVAPADFSGELRNEFADLDAAETRTLHRLCLLDPAPHVALSDSDRALAERLVVRSFLDRRDDMGYRVRAPLNAEVGRSLADPALAEALFGDLLRAPRPPHQAIRWALQRGEAVTHGQLIAALTAALTVHDWLLAEELAALAEAAEGDGSAGGASMRNRRERAEILLAHATALRFLDDPDEALARIDEAERLLEGTNADTLQARLAALHADLLHYKIGDVDAALTRLDRAAGLVTGEQSRATLLAERLIHLGYAGRFRELHRNQERDRAVLRRADASLRGRVSLLESYRLTAAGKPRQGLRRVVRLGTQHVLSRRREPWFSEELSAAYFVCAISSDGPSALPKLMRHFEESDDEHYRPDDSTFQLARASWLLQCGSIAEAEREAASGLATTVFHDPSGVAAALAALRAETSALLGETEHALAALRAASRSPWGASAIIAGGVTAHLAAAEALLAGAVSSGHGAPRRRLAGPVFSIEERGTSYLAEGAYGFAAQVWYTGVRFGERNCARRLISIEGELDGNLHELRAAQARAVVAGDPVALSEIADQLAQVGLTLYAAEAHALTARMPEAPAAVARRARQAARSLAPDLGCSAHPLLAEVLVGDEQRLTTREREIQGLIALGLTNRQIGDRLRVSPRTVEGHITRLYRKTGETRRDPGRRRTSGSG